MSDSENEVACEHHGTCAAAFTCAHLPRGVGCAFFAAEVSSEDPWRIISTTSCCSMIFAVQTDLLGAPAPSDQRPQSERRDGEQPHAFKRCAVSR